MDLPQAAIGGSNTRPYLFQQRQPGHPIRQLDLPSERATMSRFLKLADSQRAHITSLRLAIVLLALVAVGLGIGWYRAPKDMTIHVPPDLRSGSTRLWWDVPPQSVYTFGLYIFQQMNRWPVDGEQDYQANITRLNSYITPACQQYLQSDFELRRSSGELRKRVRGVYEIPGRGYGDSPEIRTVTNSIDDWTITLDITADEYYGGQLVKRALARYPLHVVRMDVDPETNPFGMAWDCYSGSPQRIEGNVETPVPQSKGVFK
ncbi:putative exported protein [Pseudomonas syringae pv. theae]|uniref:Putative exported protein n=4 Tax=Pseudomonas syringae TaxID=317 RepID=A0A3M5MVK8_PSESX|nr:putative exported protein [Pseudomonas syringae pv. theae]